MRSTLIVSAFAALALAAPRPQDIEWDQVDASPDPEIVTPPTDVTVDTVAIQPASAASAIASAAVTDVASTIAQKRDMLEVADLLSTRNADCTAEPAGTGPVVNNPDTPDAFVANQGFSDTANNAPTPQGYSLAFQNQHASTSTTSYLGYKTLSSYDTIACQEYCDQLDGCQAFNIYFERDPSITPAAGCPNPASVTNIKCVRWGVPMTPATVTNTGETRTSFKVVIAGSNGYVKNAAPPSIAGFSGPMELGGAINAPNDPVTNTNTNTNTNTYMGYKFFSFAQVQTMKLAVQACTDACTAQTAYNARHPPSTGKPNVSNQVVTYILSDNNQPQGMYCAMYSESWAQNYATNYGQYRGNDYWSVSQAYAYTNATYSAKYTPICAVGGCPSGSYRGGNCGGWGAGTC